VAKGTFSPHAPGVIVVSHSIPRVFITLIIKSHLNLFNC
jgi:hypothetical protein